MTNSTTTCSENGVEWHDTSCGGLGKIRDAGGMENDISGQEGIAIILLWTPPLIMFILCVNGAC